MLLQFPFFSPLDFTSHLKGEQIPFKFKQKNRKELLTKILGCFTHKGMDKKYFCYYIFLWLPSHCWIVNLQFRAYSGGWWIHNRPDCRYTINCVIHNMDALPLWAKLTCALLMVQKTAAARRKQHRQWEGKLTEMKITGPYQVRRYRRASPTGLNSGCGRGTVRRYRGSPHCSLFPPWQFG